MAMVGSLYLLLARHAEEAGDPYKPHQCNCPHCHIDNSARQSQVSHHGSMSSMNSRHTGPTISVTDTHATNQLSPNLDVPPPRSSLHRDSSIDGNRSINHPARNPYRQKVEKAFFKVGDILGTPAHDFITEPQNRDPSCL